MMRHGTKNTTLMGMHASLDPARKTPSRSGIAQGTKAGSALLRAEPRLRKVVELARERLGAREVWLFGSRARRDHRPDSDWDILVIVDDRTPDEALDPVALWRIGRDAGLAADVVADRISDLRACEDVASTIPYAVKREGVRLG
jgi:uncharacterized protein